MFRHNFATGNKEQMYAGYWDYDRDLDLGRKNREVETGQALFTARQAGNHSTAFVGKVATPYDPAKEAQYHS